ncbi:MAG TPA: LuxR C-terminal-related transcriptional regulator, partial [Thermomicrobiales bacterium]|nr:LuxR C-terminal-related transcriptional regulator [Thermomicrobiales bacterium]
AGQTLSRFDVFDALAALVDASLLKRDEEEISGGYPELRFSMLETIREYGLEQLAEAGEEHAAREGHLRWALALVEAAEPGVWGPDQERWLNTLEAEHDNLRAAMSWALDREPRSALALSAALWWFWQTRGYLTEGRGWLERALAAGSDADSSLLGAARLGAAFLAALQGETDAARAHAEAGHALVQAGGDPVALGRALYTLSFAAGSRGDHDAGLRYAEEALETIRASGNESWLPFALNRLGVELLERKEWDRAAPLFQEALDRWRTPEHPWGVSTALDNLAACARALGDGPRATALYRESLVYSHRQGDRWGVVESLIGLAGTAAAQGQAEVAAKLFGAADAVRASIGLKLQRYVMAEFEKAVAAVRSALGESRFAAAWEAGSTLSLAQAIADADQVAATPTAPATPARSQPRAAETVDTGGLTSREIEVLRLLAEGKSSREIGEALFISHRTATTHVTNIFTKLDVDNRATAVAKAFQMGIL